LELGKLFGVAIKQIWMQIALHRFDLPNTSGVVSKKFGVTLEAGAVELGSGTPPRNQPNLQGT
jgi:hypothetical protein